MTLDLLVLGLVLFFALVGAAAGGLMQLTHLAGIVVGGLLSHPVALALGPWAAHHLGAPQIVGVLAAGVVAFFAGYLLVQVLLRMALARVLKDRRLTRYDRLAGFVFGAARSAVVVYVLLSALVFFEKPIAQVSRYHFDTRGSRIASLVRSHDLFAHFALPGTRGLSALANAGRDPAAAARLAQDPGFQKLVHDPKIQALVHDRSLQRALQSGDVISLLRSDRVMALLSDAKLREQLSSVGERLANPAPPTGPSP